MEWLRCINPMFITELQNYRIKWFSLSPGGGLYTTCDNTPLLTFHNLYLLFEIPWLGGLIFNQTCKLQYEHMYNLMLTIFL